MRRGESHFQRAFLTFAATSLNHEEDNHAHLEVDDAVCARCGRLSALGCIHSTTNSSGTTPEQIHEDPVVLRCVAPASSEEEVFNTYGHLSNAELLLRYGFALELATEHDRITWDSIVSTEQAELCKAFGVTASDLGLRIPRIDTRRPSLSDLERSPTRLLLDDGRRLSIDGEGRISTSLLLLALTLSSYRHAVKDDFVEAAVILLSEVHRSPARKNDHEACQVLSSALQGLQQLFAGRVKAMKIRTDADREMAFELLAGVSLRNKQDCCAVQLIHTLYVVLKPYRLTNRASRFRSFQSFEWPSKSTVHYEGLRRKFAPASSPSMGNKASDETGSQSLLKIYIPLPLLT